MDQPIALHQPASLQEGAAYYLKHPTCVGGSPLLTPVTFTAYTACPAMVVVQDQRGAKFRCQREGLYEGFAR